MEYGPCGGVGADGTCEVGDLRCTFLDLPLVRWGSDDLCSACGGAGVGGVDRSACGGAGVDDLCSARGGAGVGGVCSA
ncbi:hypothetical protein, partial [Pseudonocardia pini]|uniref:hypothetical protein n=1 Tax=Pseudonocardia pini TaxID=2758030 RepID=UPI001C68F784